MPRLMKITVATVALTCLMLATSEAQISPPRPSAETVDPFKRLEDQLINRLRATTEPKQAYIRRLVAIVRAGRLELRLVRGIERKSLERRPGFPFPYFEQAIKIEASKRNVFVPTVREYELARAAATR